MAFAIGKLDLLAWLHAQHLYHMPGCVFFQLYLCTRLQKGIMKKQ
jgi:hypothetical protein